MASSTTSPYSSNDGSDATASTERILDDAATLFFKQGYDATPLRQLADSVGMRPASLYHHFASKEELLTEILRLGIAIMEEAFDNAAATSADLEPPQRIEAHVRAHLAALFENGPYTATHVTGFRTAPSRVRDAVVPMRDAYEARWTELLVELRSAGELDGSVDVGLMRLILFGAMNASIEWYDPSRGNLDAFAAQITHQFWSGVAVR